MKVSKDLHSVGTIVYSFYIINFVALLERCHRVFEEGGERLLAQLRFPLSVLPSSWNLSLIIPALSIFFMAILIVLFTQISLRIVRVVWFLLNFIIIGFEAQYSMGHSYHLFVWISFFCCLPKDWPQTSNTETWRFVLRGCQYQILLIYGISGVWKLLSLFQSLGNDNIVVGTSYLAYALSQEYINTNQSSPLSVYLATQPFISSVLSLSVLVVQLFSLFVVFFRPLYPLWAVFLALFHVGTLATVHVMFLWPVVLILLFLYQNKE
jgi:hypothetical protein